MTPLEIERYRERYTMLADEVDTDAIDQVCEMLSEASAMRMCIWLSKLREAETAFNLWTGRKGE